MPLDPRRPTSRNRTSTNRSSPLDNLRKPNPALPKLSGKSPTSRSPVRPSTSKMNRPATARSNRGMEEGEEGEFIPPPPKKNNMPIIIGAAVGGVVLLLIIIAAASGGKSSGGYQRRQGMDDYQEIKIPEYTGEKKPDLKFDGQRFEDSGAILFVCANSGKHEDKEVEINFCPNCQKKNLFCATQGTFKCFHCEVEFPKDKIVCPDCGRPPQRNVRIKHK